MAHTYFDSSYAPCGFLIVPEGGDPYADDTLLVQSDWDFAGVASSMGWVPCECGSTDGTVPCKGCHREVSKMLSEAYDFIREHEGEEFRALDDYLGL